MKKTVLLGILLLSVINIAAHNDPGRQIKITNIDVARNEDKLFISMKLDLKELSLRSNQELVLTPMLAGATDSLSMKPVVLAGRNRFFYHLRNEEQLDSSILCRVGEEELIAYQTSVPFTKWMEESQLLMHRNFCGCNVMLMNEEDFLQAIIFKSPVFAPKFIYLQPEADSVKLRKLERQSYIDFPVNLIELYPDYRNNTMELGKIIATIDTVKNNPDAHIDSISIKGYASPEGSYSNNKRLAEGRTEALKEYVQKLYPDCHIDTDSEAEDWEGLRKYVDASDLEHKAGILALIESTLDLDAKERKLKQTYPTEYAFLLKEVYPGLRHSDYVVNYTIREYTDIEEAKAVFRTRPGNLSLNEMYLIAQTYPKGSEEFNEVFATMVRLFPDDEVANLNAANVAMSHNDLISSEKYLKKAGDSSYAYYARGVHAGLSGNYEIAEKYLTVAKEQGVAEAEDALEQLKQFKKE